MLVYMDIKFICLARHFHHLKLYKSWLDISVNKTCSLMCQISYIHMGKTSQCDWEIIKSVLQDCQREGLKNKKRPVVFR